MPRINEPTCRHKRKGIVTAGNPQKGPHAVHNVCDRPGCIVEVKEWCRLRTGMEPVVLLDKDMKPATTPEPQGQQSSFFD